MHIFHKFFEWFLTTWFLVNLLAVLIQLLSMKTTKSMFMPQNNLLKFCYLNLNEILFLQIRKNFNRATSLCHSIKSSFIMLAILFVIPKCKTLRSDTLNFDAVIISDKKCTAFILNKTLFIYIRVATHTDKKILSDQKLA